VRPTEGFNLCMKGKEQKKGGTQIILGPTVRERAGSLARVNLVLSGGFTRVLLGPGNGRGKRKLREAQRSRGTKRRPHRSQKQRKIIE